MDKTTEEGFSAEYVADKTLDMVVKKDNDLVISQFLPKLAIFLRHNSPSIFYSLMYKRAKVTSLP